MTFIYETIYFHFLPYIAICYTNVANIYVKPDFTNGT